MFFVCSHRFLGGRRFSEGTSADREIQRTLMEVRYQFESVIYSIFNNDILR
jgi:ATP-dependent 26S proteasome regulatory subunit